MYHANFSNSSDEKSNIELGISNLSSCHIECDPCLKEVVILSLSVAETKIAEFSNSVDLDEVAHNEPPHLDLHCLLSCLWILSKI